MSNGSGGGEKDKRPISAPSHSIFISKGEFLAIGLEDLSGGVTANPRSFCKRTLASNQYCYDEQ